MLASRFGWVALNGFGTPPAGLERLGIDTHTGTRVRLRGSHSQPQGTTCFFPGACRHRGGSRRTYISNGILAGDVMSLSELGYNSLNFSRSARDRESAPALASEDKWIA